MFSYACTQESIDVWCTESRMNFVCALLFIGHSGTGKSSLLLRFTDDTFDEDIGTTIGYVPWRRCENICMIHERGDALWWLHYLMVVPLLWWRVTSKVCMMECAYCDAYLFFHFLVSSWCLCSVDFKKKNVDVNGTEVILTLWDTAGQVRKKKQRGMKR